MFTQIAATVRVRSRLWVRDPDKMCTLSSEELTNRLGSNHTVIVARSSLSLRLQLESGLPVQFILLDQVPSGVHATNQLFAPDILSKLSNKDIITRTIRDYLVDCTQDASWPQDVEAFPFREIARERPEAFIKAYDDFHSSQPSGFSHRDLVLIAASAVLEQNLLGIGDTFQWIKLAFHSEEKWSHLSEYFNDEEIGFVKDYLKTLPCPFGDLFGDQAHSARLAISAIIILSRHTENPGMLLSMLSPALAPWQACNPIVLSEQYPPGWFQEEILLFDNAVSEQFLRSLGNVFELSKEECRKELARKNSWSRRIRELVILESEHISAESNERLSVRSPKPEENLESIIPKFQYVLHEIETINNIVKEECNQISITQISQRDLSKFLHTFKDSRLYKLHLLSAQLQEYRHAISILEMPSSLREKWTAFEQRVDSAVAEAAEALHFFDRLWGQFLELQYSTMIKGQILSTNQMVVKAIYPNAQKTPQRPLAILLLDGMRYDLWREIIRPHLERRYSVEETIGIAMLPSETRISRTGFFSGLLPREFNGRSLSGGETSAFERLIKKVDSKAPAIAQWDIIKNEPGFAFKSKDDTIFGAVLAFADEIGHAGAWEIDFLAQLVQVWLKKLNAFLNALPKDCEVWITADHGQVVCGSAMVEIPSHLLVADKGNGYRSALVNEKLQGDAAKRVFQFSASELGFEGTGYWVFPRPGYGFLQVDKGGEIRKRFVPLKQMRHSGVSAFEVLVPLARLTSRKKDVLVKLSTIAPRSYKKGEIGHLQIEVSANCIIQDSIEICSNNTDVQPMIVSGISDKKQSIKLPFTPRQIGTTDIILTARWGLETVGETRVTVTIEGDDGRKQDSLDDKLKKLFN
jgi:flagellar biosynthesis/type III secretory pathway chaperone